MSGSNTPSVDLYPGVVAFTIFIITYTCGSALSAGFTHLLFRLNGKQVVYVSLMSLSIFLQNMLTVAQESFSLSMWSSLQVETYEENLTQWRNPNASIVYQTLPNLSIKIIFNMRTYFFNVESLLFFFWSLMLFVSVWEIQNRVIKSEKFVAGSKYFCFILPAFQLILTNLEPVVKIPILHLIFGNCTMVITLSAGCIFMGLILFKCIHVMWSSNWAHQVKAWRGYDNGRRPPTRRPATHNSVSSSSSGSDNEDRYILLRFLAGFAIIGGLQASFLMSQVTYAKGVIKRKQPDAERPQLGWSASEQTTDWAFYLASASTGYLILVVFGTTRESRRQIRRIWSDFRGRACGGKRRDSEYTSFRGESNSVDTPYDSTPTPDMSERRRTKPPPKPMTFISSRTTPLQSPGEGANNFSPGYADVDLKTPRI